MFRFLLNAPSDYFSIKACEFVKAAHHNLANYPDGSMAYAWGRYYLALAAFYDSLAEALNEPLSACAIIAWLR